MMKLYRFGRTLSSINFEVNKGVCHEFFLSLQLPGDTPRYGPVERAPGEEQAFSCA
jgi:hypothetical protein